MSKDNNILDRYKNKVKAVEREKNAYQNSFTSDGSAAYSMGGSFPTDNRDLSGLNQETYQTNPSSGAWWPTKNINTALSAHYKARAVQPLSEIVMHLDYYRNNKTIKLPTCKRSIYVATMLKHIEDNAKSYTDLTGSDMFSLIDTTKFTVRQANVKPCYRYLRKDFNIYLEALWEKVHKQLNVSKLYISSGYRDIEMNAEIYNGKPGGSAWGGHIVGIAVDITAHGVNRAIIADAAHAMGFGEIYIGRSFVHVDIGPHLRYKDPNSGAPKYNSPSSPGRGAYA